MIDLIHLALLEFYCRKRIISKWKYLDLIYRNLYRLFFKKGLLYIIKIDLTKKCNLNCKFCYQKKENLYIPYNQVLSVIDSLRVGVIELMGGEPLLYPKIYDVIKQIKKKRFLRCHLYSNGTLINPSVAKKLKLYGLDAAIITIYSNNKVIHDKSVGMNGSFEKSIEGIKNLIKEGIKVYTYTTITSENINNLKEISQFSKSLGASAIFHKYMPQKKNDILAIKDLDKWQSIKHWILFKMSRSHGEYVKNMVLLQKRQCMGGHLEYSIKVNGNVTPCPFVDDIILGNLKRDNLKKIVKNRFKNKNFLQFYNTSNECLNCSIKELCKSGCRINYLDQGYNHKDFLCKGPWKKRVKTDELCDYLPYWW